MASFVIEGGHKLHGDYRSVLLSECQNIAAFVPESGCKSRPFMDICKIYTRFF